MDNILTHFPTVDFAFAYGSAIFPQEGYKDNHQLVFDYIYAVENPNEWHQKNLDQNPKHYASLMKIFGHKKISNFQNDWGASIYFNTLVPMDDGKVCLSFCLLLKSIDD